MGRVNSYMERVFGDDLLLTLFMISYILIFLYFFVLRQQRRKQQERHTKNSEEAFTLLTDGFNKNTLSDDIDIYMIYKKIVSKTSTVSYSSFLENYIIYLRRSSDVIENFTDINVRIKNIINQEQSAKPFEGVNDHEKRLLLAIDDCAKINNTASIHHTLDELSMVLRSNQHKMSKAENTNKWTVPLAIIGFVLTIASWFLSGGISQADVERINENTKTIIEEKLDSNRTLD